MDTMEVTEPGIATRQDIFDLVSRHLMHRGRKNTALDAIGCLLEDREAHLANDASWVRLIWRCRLTTRHYGLIIALQKIHFYEDPQEWGVRLEALAKERGLRVREEGLTSYQYVLQW
jgi:hypothetical protein